MAFKIIEWLQAVVALIECFTGSRTKLADAPCMKGAALWTGNGFIFCKQLNIAHLLNRVGRRNAVSGQLPFAGLAHPVGSPGRRQHLFDAHFFESLFQ